VKGGVKITLSSKIKTTDHVLQQNKHTSSERMEISPGVYYTHLQLENDTLIESAHVLEVDVANPFMNMHVLSPDMKVGKLGRVRDIIHPIQTSEQPNLVTAVNGDFFSHLGIPSGLQISDGEIMTSPRMTKVSMILKNDRSIKLSENVFMYAEITAGERKLQIDAINRTRKLKHDNHLFLYNTRFRDSTKTPEGGVEVIVSLETPKYDKLTTNQTMRGHVQSIATTADTAIRPGNIILSATGKKAKWLVRQLSKGSNVSIDITFDRDVNDAKEVISGNSTLAYTLLTKGHINDEILDSNNPYTLHRHPRTMLATKGDILHIIVVDGRQPGYSDGITMAEGARYLQHIGMENAINIDGGGSTTCFIRKTGDTTTTLVNRPSDGFEREIGNALAITSSAPVEELAKIVPVQGRTLKMLINSRKVLKIKGHDKYINPYPLSQTDVSWRSSGHIGTINDQGYFQAGTEAQSGEIIIQKDDIIEKISVQVVEHIAQLEISPERIVVEPGKSIEFTVIAYDADGDKVFISTDQLNWSVKGDIGSIDEKGCFQAKSTVLEGEVEAEYSNIRSTSKVNIGQQPELITGFETIDHLSITQTRSIEDSVTLNKVERPNPVRFGRFSGKLTYDFTGMSGTSKATINFNTENDVIGAQVKGRPYRFGLWVYGDGKNHWLRIGVADANDETQSLNFTSVGGLDWIGWKYVYTEIPSHFAYPITVLTLYLMETNDANKNRGAIYFDNLRAEYIALDEDVTGPVFSEYEPKPNTGVTRSDTVNVRVRINDSESGVDPASVIMWINGERVNCIYNALSGVAEYRLGIEALNPSNHVVVEAIDNAGNPSVPKAEWKFSFKDTNDSSNRNKLLKYPRRK